MGAGNRIILPQMRIGRDPDYRRTIVPCLANDMDQPVQRVAGQFPGRFFQEDERRLPEKRTNPGSPLQIRGGELLRKADRNSRQTESPRKPRCFSEMLFGRNAGMVKLLQKGILEQGE